MNLYNLLQRPQPYEKSTSIWTDKYTNPNMNKAHLDPANDAASYRPERMDRVYSYLTEKLNLIHGAKLIDLGCGPGLYSLCFARDGIAVTGLDMSEYSINYARNQAKNEGLDITYILQDYRHQFGCDEYNAAILISEDYGVMSYSDRQNFLANVFTSLRSGGKFALDVSSYKIWESLKETSNWRTEEAGFLRPHPHTILSKIWLFPEEAALSDICVVIDDNITRYINHQTYFTQERITKELESAGFIVEEILNNLEGIPYDGNNTQMGVIARKP